MSKRFQTTITFSINDVNELHIGDRTELKKFIVDALETWGGQRRPDDWLFDSLEHVTLSAIKEVKE